MGTLRELAAAASLAARRAAGQQLAGARHAWQRYRLEREDGFDREHGTDTSISPLPTLAHLRAMAGGARPTRHMPTMAREARGVFGALPPLRHEDYTFVDIGSGKGRMVMLASEYPFRRVVGVEFSPALHRRAEKNVRVFRSPRQRCHAFDLRCQDATAYEFPDDNLVVFLFNPFDSGTMERVVANLERSLDRRPREVAIVYINPRAGAAIERSSRFRKVAERDAPYLAVYATPALAAAAGA